MPKIFVSRGICSEAIFKILGTRRLNLSYNALLCQYISDVFLNLNSYLMRLV